MSLNRITRTALEAEIETDQKILEQDGATPELVRDKLECICYFIEDSEVQKGAGAAAPMLIGAKWAIRKWLNRQKGG